MNLEWQQTIIFNLVLETITQYSIWKQYHYEHKMYSKLQMPNSTTVTTVTVTLLVYYYYNSYVQDQLLYFLA